MKLFKKKTCNCTDNSLLKITPSENTIKILGAGCKKCISLEKATRAALAELNFDTEVEHITDFTQIAAYGVISTPALVINEKVVSYGKVLSMEEVKTLLENFKNQ